MSDKSVLERIAGSIALVSIAVAVTGTKACQENYTVGGQASITNNPTGSVTPSVSATITGTITVTIAVTESPEPTVSGSPTIFSPTPSPTDDASVLDSEAASGGSGSGAGLLQELSTLGDKSDEDPTAQGGGAGGSGKKGDGNWLGKGFDGSQWQDSDGDGFSDSREEASQSDPNDSSSIPSDVERGQLDVRLRQLDQDMDGLLNDEETKRGTNPNLSDSDGDGRTDGAEVVSGGNPLDPSDLYVDADGDGLANTFEESKGTSSNSNDSDGDGLRDDLELVVGSNPTRIDSDGDGISDGREYDLNSDPLLGEPDKAG